MRKQTIQQTDNPSNRQQMSRKLSMIVDLDTAEHFIFAAYYYCVFKF